MDEIKPPKLRRKNVILLWCSSSNCGDYGMAVSEEDADEKEAAHLHHHKQFAERVKRVLQQARAPKLDRDHIAAQVQAATGLKVLGVDTNEEDGDTVVVEGKAEIDGQLVDVVGVVSDKTHLSVGPVSIPYPPTHPQGQHGIEQFSPVIGKDAENA